MHIPEDTLSKIKALGYKCHGLLDGNGQWLLRPNPSKETSRLPNVLQMLESLPAGKYKVNCSNGQGLRGAHFNYDIETSAKTEFSENGTFLSQGAKSSLATAERFGRLEAENKHLQEQNEALRDEIEALKAELAEIEDLEDLEDLDEQEPAPQTLNEKILENVAPVIPQLADKLLNMIDLWMHKQKPNLAESGPPNITPEIADLIAEKVKQKMYDDLQNMPTDGN